MDRTAGTLAIYLNGVLAASGTVRTQPAAQNTAPLLIGRSTEDGNNYNYSGAMDDVRIFSRALSASEIAANYKTALTGTQTGLALYLPMNDASGAATLVDSSPNAATVTIVRPDAGLPGVITDRIAAPGQTRNYTFTLSHGDAPAVRRPHR